MALEDFKLLDYVNENHIFFDVKGDSKKDVLTEIVHKICAVESIVDEEQAILASILKREEIESTAIGKGFAIPHCYYENFTGVKLYVGIPEFPIDFKSKNNGMVRVIFTIISGDDTNEVYLKALSRLIYLLRNIDVREKLISLSAKEDFLKLVQESDNEMNYISYKGLQQIVSLLNLEEEIDTYSHEALIGKNDKKSKDELENDPHYLKLMGSHGNLSKEIDTRLIQIYKQLKQKYGGDIIAKVKNNICGHCNVQLPVHIIREINRKNQIIQCFTCSKILVLTRGKLF